MGKRSRRRGGHHDGQRAHREPRDSQGPRRQPLDRLLVEAMAGHPRAIDGLATAWDAGQLVAPLLDRGVHGAFGAALKAGWTPREVARIVGKHAGADARHLVEAAGSSVGRPVVDTWRSRRRLEAPAAVRTALDATVALGSLPRPPGGATSPVGRQSGVDPALLDRVRALLAKAESTTFPAEAEALSAKAHELMARHAIDAAVVAGAQPTGAVASRRIGIDDPYASAKVQLVHEVAVACRCQAVWAESVGVVTVFGHAGDLEAVDLLHTSLLVQATTAMLAAGSAQPGARSRSRAFRNAFLVAFAVRVGQRLREATAAVVDDAAAEHGDRLLPVLASRAEAVDAAVREACPNLVQRRTSTSDSTGWRAGHAAASQADLGTARFDTPPRHALGR